MTLKIEKDVTLTAGGLDIQTIRNACECARIYLEKHNFQSANPSYAGQFNTEEAERLDEFVSWFLENTSL